MKHIIYILLAVTQIVFSQNEQLFEKANSLYNNEQYNDAILVYDQILNTKQHSVDVYFNKANAHYKLNQIAESIYNYEKALQLDSSNEDVLTNLAFANNMRIDEIDVIPTSGFSKLFSAFVNMMSFDTWAILAIVFMLLFVGCFVLYSLSKYTSKKRIYFVTALAGLLLSVLSVAFAYQQESYVKTTQYAIVFSKESKVKTDPKLSSEDAFTLHEGTKVKVLEVFDGWVKIKLTNGSTGWLVQTDIKNL
ncbi:MAG: tetratricopeptide repeat protein [Flavobacteriaceae bacterium]